MNDSLNSLIDSIRAQERNLSNIATRKAKASAEAHKAQTAVTEQTDTLQRLSLSERSLGEVSGKLRAKAARALSRGLLPDELAEGLGALAQLAQISTAGGMLTESIDSASKEMIDFQRAASNANQALEAIETEFSEAETMLEDLRDQLRILQQSQPA